MLLPHIHREGSTLAPAGHTEVRQENKPLTAPLQQLLHPEEQLFWGKIKEQVKKAWMLKPLGHLTLWLGSAGESRSSQCSLRGVLEELKLAWKLHLRAKVIPVVTPVWAEGGWAAQSQHHFIPAPLHPLIPSWSCAGA